jgi:hypothetical protein
LPPYKTILDKRKPGELKEWKPQEDATKTINKRLIE